MSHKPTHTITLHAHGYHQQPHGNGTGYHIRDIAQKLVEEVRKAGYEVSHSGILTDGEHVELHHLPNGDAPVA